MICKNKFIIVLTGTVYALILQSCSSSTETEKKEEIRYETKSIKNLDLEEREYISTSKISSIEKVNFDFDPDGKPLKNEKLSSQKFDSKGFLTETVTYDDAGKVEYKYAYNYDDEGRRIKTTRFKKNKIINYYEYDYNNFGNKSKAYRYDSEGNLEEYYIYEYDRYGNLTEEEWYTPSGKKIYSVENEYEDGIKTRSFTYDENDDLIYEYTFGYDEKGNVIEEIKNDEKGIQAGIIQYIYKYY